MPARQTALQVVGRVLLVIGGGYVAASAIVAGLAVLLAAFGAARSEAVVSASMLGFFVYLALLIWGFAERRVWRFAAMVMLSAGLGLLCVLIVKSGG